MENQVTLYFLAIKTFVQTKNGADFHDVFKCFPKDIQDYRVRFGKMLINPENHLFFIISTLLAEWANDILGDENITDKKALGLIDDFGNLFEFVPDEVSLEEQESVLNQAEDLLQQI